MEASYNSDNTCPKINQSKNDLDIQTLKQLRVTLVIKIQGFLIEEIRKRENN